jgi:hypothetical protein
MAQEPLNGFGQSLWDDLRYAFRFWSRRRRAVTWRAPTEAEQREFEAHPVISRFGDPLPLVADVGTERWLVRERMWWGWPDPPRYVFFALEGGRIFVAQDFNSWPAGWRPRPDDGKG